jgi:hypothetical protein
MDRDHPSLRAFISDEPGPDISDPLRTLLTDPRDTRTVEHCTDPVLLRRALGIVLSEINDAMVSAAELDRARLDRLKRLCVLLGIRPEPYPP